MTETEAKPRILETAEEVAPPATLSLIHILCSIACGAGVLVALTYFRQGATKVAPYGSTGEVTLRNRDLPSRCV